MQALPEAEGDIKEEGEEGSSRKLGRRGGGGSRRKEPSIYIPAQMPGPYQCFPIRGSFTYLFKKIAFSCLVADGCGLNRLIKNALGPGQ